MPPLVNKATPPIEELRNGIRTLPSTCFSGIKQHFGLTPSSSIFWTKVSQAGFFSRRAMSPKPLLTHSIRPQTGGLACVQPTMMRTYANPSWYTSPAHRTRAVRMRRGDPRISLKALGKSQNVPGPSG